MPDEDSTITLDVVTAAGSRVGGDERFAGTLLTLIDEKATDLD
jgi:hypothetical protein